MSFVAMTVIREFVGARVRREILVSRDLSKSKRISVCMTVRMEDACVL